MIAAGNRSLILQTELKEKTCKNQPFNTVFKVQNLNGQPVEVKGTFSLYQAKDADFKQLDENPAATGTFTSNEEMTKPSFRTVCVESSRKRWTGQRSAG